MADILLAAPTTQQGYELLTIAKSLKASGKIVYAALGEQAGSAQEFASRGADRVLTNADPKLKDWHAETTAEAFAQLVENVKPGIVLVGASTRTKDAVGRLAARLKVGAGCELMNVRLEGGRLTGERTYYSGRSHATEQLTKDPQLATVAARMVEAAKPDASRSGAVEEVKLTLADPKAKLVKREKKETGGVHLEDAKIVVSAGRGVKKKEDLKLAEDLAKACGGQVGCTRPIAADLKWLSDAHWIGLSGHEVKPKTYIGLGVSGQIQHVAGMRGSKLIIAINKDEEAPLVKISDYAIVDDLYKVVPPLIEAVKKAKAG